MSDFTILIQGPINTTSLSAIENYKKYGEVVVSCWDDDSKKHLLPTDIPVAAHPLPDIKKSVGALHRGTFYWAVCSQNNGFKIVNTKYVIKTRSDQRFLKLEPFIDKFLENPERFTCGNIFARKWNDVPYHIGDHIYVVKNKYMLEATSTLRSMYEKKLPLLGWAKERRKKPHMRSAEQILAWSYLCFGKKIKATEWAVKRATDDVRRKTFDENFYIVDINKTEKFLVQHRHKGWVWEDHFVNRHGIYSHEDI